MTAHEMQVWLRAHFAADDTRREWKAWTSPKQNASGRKGEDLVSCVPALGKMDGGCIVIGVQAQTLAVTGSRDFGGDNAENVVHRSLGKTPALPSIGLRVEPLRASDTGAVIWLVHVPRHAARQPVHAHKAWQRDGDSLAERRAGRLQAISERAADGA